ncbi:MAG: hypothetical protein J7639_32950 [Paenibacillaceae bacterium]|nr:hypothetical protein [Paenibacillaceae bacterium]
MRISGQDPGRLAIAAEFALEQGLEVWLSPSYVDATEEMMLAYLTDCAKAAESLRQKSPNVIFVTGCELSLFMKGFIAGETAAERMQTMMKPWRLLASSLRRGSFHRRLNAFLTRAADAIREHFRGRLTYASGTWENVDWRPFDYVGIDCYRDSFNKRMYREKLRSYFRHVKPVVVLEFGCCTYRGAEDKGGYGWAVVDRSAAPNRLKAGIERDESVQVRYMEELLTIFAEEGVDGAFWFTFVMPLYPGNDERSDDPAYDLDTASYGLVKPYADPNRSGSAYPGLPWEPKASFHALSRLYE